MITSFSELVSLDSGLYLRGSAGLPAAGARWRTCARGDADFFGDQLAVFHQPFAYAQLGLGDEIDGAQFKRPHGDFAAAIGQRRHHHHRHGPQAHQPFEKIQAVHARHFHVQRQHVGVVLLDQLARHQRVGRGGHDFHVGVGVDDLGHQAPHQGGIVHA
jgi:hypothetical protein